MYQNRYLHTKQKSTRVVLFCFGEYREPTRVEGGAVLREQNALPSEERITINLTAKDDIDNVGAGRAAKGATLVACSKNRKASKRGLSILLITYSLFTFHLEIACRFLKVISNSEKVWLKFTKGERYGTKFSCFFVSECIDKV